MLASLLRKELFMTPGTHLAHISDLHLPPPSIPWTAFFNKRLLSRILWLGNRRYVHQANIVTQLLDNIKSCKEIQALLITGDQTNFGTTEEYQATAKWLEKLPLPAMVVPGNHDFMAPISQKKSLDLWQDWSGPDYPWVRLVDKVAIIGLNSSLPTLPFTAYGRITPKQYRRLEILLKYYKEKKCCRVVMIHHPPRKGLLPRRKSLLDTRKLAQCLARHGAELVIHGHSHNATFTTVEGTKIPLLGVSSASLKSKQVPRIASWNHLHFLQDFTGWNITVTRQSYQGEQLAEYGWHSTREESLEAAL